MERYTLKKPLGIKGFGKTYLAVDEAIRKDCVVKVIDTSIMNPAEYDGQIIISRVVDKLKHENLINYIDAVEDNKKGQYNIITEYCPGKPINNIGGNLADLIENYKTKGELIDEETIYQLLIGMLLGVQYLHKNGIIHRGLKPQNVLLTQKKEVKISDFAISMTFKDYKKYPYPMIGTYIYLSPEELALKKFRPNTDIWSIGCIMHELCCLKVLHTYF